DNLGLYFAGDTGFCRRLFKGIGQSFKIDIAFLPVGPDDLLFKWYHLGAKDAIRAYKLLGAKVFIPIHWGVVKGTSGDSLKTVRKLLGFSLPYLRLLNVGDKVSLGELLNREGAFAPPDLNFLKQV
ncbi:MAG: MBL fold metallo-hydrolase, partial [Chloroflexi bacterium]|nr:MBL fold metallo-hydrolase [Chloroflexota bacterium]